MTRNGAGIRSRVVQDLEQVTRWLAALRHEARPEELETAGDNTPLSEPGDAARVVEEREVQSQLLDWLAERSVDLRRALLRIDDGTYGVCGRCGRSIHAERLHALPEAALCLGCQTEVETGRQGGRPAEPGWIEAALTYREGSGSD